MHKSSIFVADELQREHYCQGNFQGPDYHLGNFKEYCMVSVAKCQWKRSEYVITSVYPDQLKHHRLLVAFERCLNVTALPSRCMANMVFKMDAFSRIMQHRPKGDVCSKFSSVTTSQLTKHFEMLLHNGFDQSTLKYTQKLWHVSYYGIKQDLVAVGEKCGFTCLRVSHFSTYSPCHPSVSLSTISPPFLLFYLSPF